MGQSTVWLIDILTSIATAETVIEFMEMKTFYGFLPFRTVFSDNATCFMVAALQEKIWRSRIKWKPVAYARLSSVQAERMVVYLKRSVGWLLASDGTSWNEALPKSIHGYKRHRGQSDFSLFVFLFGHPPRITPIENGALISSSGEDAQISENLAIISIRATRAVWKSHSVNNIEPGPFITGEKVFFAKGPDVQPT